MLTSFSEFKFYQSFRIPVEAADDLRFLVEIDEEFGKKNHYIDDAKLMDISVTGLGFSTRERISVGTELEISLQFRKLHIDLTGRVVRAFSDIISDDEIIYGIELDEEKKLGRFLEQYIQGFSPERLRNCLIESSLKERYTKASDGFEMFSLLLSLFKDITNFGDKDGFIDNMLDEVVRILNAQRSSIFLINPETNELEAVNALGIEKDTLRFDYRLGIAGSVFTTGVALNIDTVRDKTRFNEAFDKQSGFQTKSIICYPIHNREDKIIGVIEVLNKRNQTRFTVEDEKTMKVMTLVFSSVFHNYNPLSEISMIRRFSTPFDREDAIIGNSPHISTLRRTIVKIKDIDAPVLIYGEHGVGKFLYGKIIHFEGQRGLKLFEVVDCATCDEQELEKQLFINSEKDNKLIQCQGGTLVLRQIEALPYSMQKRLFSILRERRIPDSKIVLDVRIITTTCWDLGHAANEGEFDRNLHEYISQAYIRIGPLRKRPGDIPQLVDYFLKIECQRQGLLYKKFSSRAIDKFVNYDWPGNIKELRTCVERAVLYNPKIHILDDIDTEGSDVAPLFDVDVKKRMFGELPYVSDFRLMLKSRVAIIEREMIQAEIKRLGGNKSKAAKEMGISREALRKKLIYSDQVIAQLDEDRACQIKDIKKAA